MSLSFAMYKLYYITLLLIRELSIVHGLYSYYFIYTFYTLKYTKYDGNSVSSQLEVIKCCIITRNTKFLKPIHGYIYL